MRKLSIVLLVGLMLIGGLSVGIYAQSSSTADSANEAAASNVEATVSADAEIGVKTIAAIYIDHGSVDLGVLDSSKLTIDDSDASLGNLTPVDDPSFNVYAYANQAYTVSVEPDSASAFSGLDGQLQIDTDAGGSWSDLWTGSSKSSVGVINGNAGNYNSQEIDYRYKPSKTDTPGSYTATLNYTVSTN